MAAEQTLVERARSGDHDAFRVLVERYQDLVAATVTGMLGSGPVAEDVSQEVFVRFYEALDQYRGEGGVAPYLTRIAVNRSLNALDRRKRKRQRLQSRDASDAPLGPAIDGEHAAQAFDQQELVQRALQALSEKHRTVIVLRDINGYSTAETAELLDVPTGTVLSRLYRARKKLQSLLVPYLQDDA